jgi:hypothetical protein
MLALISKIKLVRDFIYNSIITFHLKDTFWLSIGLIILIALCIRWPFLVYLKHYGIEKYFFIVVGISSVLLIVIKRFVTNKKRLSFKELFKIFVLSIIFYLLFSYIIKYFIKYLSLTDFYLIKSFFGTFIHYLISAAFQDLFVDEPLYDPDIENTTLELNRLFNVGDPVNNLPPIPPQPPQLPPIIPTWFNNVNENAEYDPSDGILYSAWCVADTWHNRDIPHPYDSDDPFNGETNTCETKMSEAIYQFIILFSRGIDFTLDNYLSNAINQKTIKLNSFINWMQPNERFKYIDNSNFTHLYRIHICDKWLNILDKLFSLEALNIKMVLNTDNPSINMVEALYRKYLSLSHIKLENNALLATIDDVRNISVWKYATPLKTSVITSLNKIITYNNFINIRSHIELNLLTKYYDYFSHYELLLEMDRFNPNNVRVQHIKSILMGDSVPLVGQINIVEPYEFKSLSILAYKDCNKNILDFFEKKACEIKIKENVIPQCYLGMSAILDHITSNNVEIAKENGRILKWPSLYTKKGLIKKEIYLRSLYNNENYLQDVD